MRNLEDCKAEVFRRSEERIKERKRTRNRVLACCIPLCLLLAVGGLYLRPLLEPVDELMKSKSEGTVAPERNLGGTEFTLLGGVVEYTAVEITDRTGDTELVCKVTYGDTVKELCHVVGMSFIVPTTEESGSTPEKESEVVFPESSVNDKTGNSGDKTSADGNVSEETTAGQDRDTVTDEYELRVKYGLDDKKADYTFVFQTEAGESFVFRLCENVLFNDQNGCAVVLTDAQLAVLKAQIEAATVEGSKRK